MTGQSNFWTIMAIFSGMRWLKKRFGGKQEVTVLGGPLRQGEKYSLVYDAPPKGRKSMTATFQPAARTRVAAFMAALPAPITTRS